MPNIQPGNFTGCGSKGVNFSCALSFIHSFTDFIEFYWTTRRPLLRDICANVFVHSVTHFSRTFDSFLLVVFNSAPARVLTVF